MRKKGNRWLYPHIYRYLEAGGQADSDLIVDHLNKTLRGFERKPQNILKKAVDEILKEFLPENTSQVSTPNSASQAEVAQIPSTPERLIEEEIKKDPTPQPVKRRRLAASVNRQLESSLRFSDIGGIESIMKDIEQLLMYPLKHPEVFRELRIEPATGILLCGPPGTGKTYLAHAICGELGLPFYKVSAPEIIAGVSGESEQKIRDLFSQAKESSPSVIFIDEIDAIAPRRSSTNKDMEKRIVSQLLTSIDDLHGFLDHGKLVIVLAATNRIDSIDAALRRAGRFDREIHFGIPSDSQRERILEVLVNKVKCRGDIDLKLIAKRTPGYVGADLHSLLKEAGNIAIERIMNLGNSMNLADLYIENDDFMQAIQKVQPSSKREGFTTIPDTNWEDVGGLSELREELNYTIVHAIQEPEKYRSVGITAAAGVLLCGPPGCGKTLIAKAVANESRANFIAVNGPELLNKYVGESERAVRQLFQRARDSAPCVVFFDEIDALCSARGGDNQATERVVNQLLTELGGFEDRREVFVIAATNRPDIIDPAMLRPGRLDKTIYVPLPNEHDRLSILQTLCRKTPVDPAVDLEKIAQATEGYTGADIASLVREAACYCLRSNQPPFTVAQQHFAISLNKLRPSVSVEQKIHYEKMRERLHMRRV